ncbi:uncharacterized protein C8A04DRAFT_33591 [Dichotomopilus funicola]|uniref:Major facilitator superfamily transporter n=1 Tax=Dichotomopilus funicola TaxID=1934379 RepID=A0AAN6VAZ8_9PEZI|nr:hypothetical protein C8A04DRAFT_33591 [Dichotomopilus funicola]
MERRSFLPRSSSLSTLLPTSDEKYYLPRSVQQKRRFKLRTLLGHCFYRRVILWILAALALLILGLSTTSENGLRRERLLELVQSRPYEETHDVSEHVVEEEAIVTGSRREKVMVVTSSEKAPPPAWREGMPYWLRFKHLDGFFVGLKALVPAREYQPEHPRKPGEGSPFPLTISYTGLPTPTPYVPHPDYESEKYTAEHHEAQPCYLDKAKQIPVPEVYAYDGIIQGQSEPVLGSHNLLGLRDDVCFDRFGRYGPYGLGYTFEEGGVEVGMDTERTGNEVVWEKTGKINYDTIDWAEAQARCLDANKKRFRDPADKDQPSTTTSSGKGSGSGKAKQDGSKQGAQEDPTFVHSERPKKKIGRTAVVVRAYTGYQWTHHAVLNFRAMISELSLRSGGEYTVHFLLHVRDGNEAIWADPITAQRILDDNIPPEFHGLCTMWSEDQMRLIYPGGFGRSFSNPSSGSIHGVYRSAHMPLQYFALNHPEYDHFWNWELDMRWLGNYYELFDRLGNWGREQSRVGAWERSSKYYIPRYHGDWANFTSLVHNETAASGRPAVFGPVSFPGRVPLRSEASGESFIPRSCATRADPSCGVGEDADLITLNPLFDAEDSGWVFASDVTGYNTALPPPPRRCAIVTASRLSRRLLGVMHEENWRLHNSMFTEMFPASVALHRGLKAVYAPHPVFVDREWELAAVDKAFNGGRDHTSGGRGSPFDLRNEHNHKGTSWYYHSEFAGLLWRRWLGYAQYDGRGPNGGRSGEGTLRGGKVEEERASSTGRMCLRSMLVHPIKWEHPSELEDL